MKFYTSCGTPIEDQDAFCPKCGTRPALCCPAEDKRINSSPNQRQRAKWYFSWELIFAALSYLVILPSLIALLCRKLMKMSTDLLSHHMVRALIINIAYIFIAVTFVLIKQSPNFVMFAHDFQDISHGIQTGVMITTKYTTMGLIWTISNRFGELVFLVIRLIGICLALCRRKWERRRSTRIRKTNSIER